MYLVRVGVRVRVRGRVGVGVRVRVRVRVRVGVGAGRRCQLGTTLDLSGKPGVLYSILSSTRSAEPDVEIENWPG